MQQDIVQNSQTHEQLEHVVSDLYTILTYLPKPLCPCHPQNGTEKASPITQEQHGRDTVNKKRDQKNKIHVLKNTETNITKPCTHMHPPTHTHIHKQNTV